jgi:hypothetical protein
VFPIGLADLIRAAGARWAVVAEGP